MDNTKLEALRNTIATNQEEYTQKYTEKLSQSEDFVNNQKTKYSHNITLEDWNALQNYVAHLNSDSTVQDEYLAKISTILDDIVLEVIGVNTSLNNFKDEFHHLGTFSSNESIARAAIEHRLSTNTNCLYRAIRSTPGGSTSYIIITGNTASTGYAILIGNQTICHYELYNNVISEISITIPKLNVTSELNAYTANVKVKTPTNDLHAVNLAYLKNNYYNSTYINDTYYSKTHIDDTYYSKTSIDNFFANYVDLTSEQTVYGAKKFVNDVALYGETASPYLAFKTATKNNYFGFNSDDRPIVKNTANVENSLAYTTDVSTALSQAIAYTDNAISGLIDGAPELLNTFKEIADYIARDETNAAAMLANIQNNTTAVENLNNTKADRAELFSGNYSDLEGTPDEALIIIRDSVSEDTTLVIKEIELNGIKWKTDDSVDLSNYYNIEQTNNKIDEKINAAISSVLTADY